MFYVKFISGGMFQFRRYNSLATALQFAQIRNGLVLNKFKQPVTLKDEVVERVVDGVINDLNK